MTEIYEAFVQHGCRVWTVTAHELETAIKNLILTQRASAGYEAEVRAILIERELFQAGAANAVAAAAESQYRGKVSC